jgi:hypothetical protein
MRSESIYEMPNGYKYNIAIAIGGINEDQQFFLIPPPHEFAEWEYWKFAHWYPCEVPAENLFEYFKEVTEFCEELINEDETPIQFNHSP